MTDPDRPADDREPGPGSDSVEAQLRELREQVEVLADLVHDAMHPTAEDHAAEGERAATTKAAAFELEHASLESWVTNFFAPTFCRATSPSVRWCAKWWDHAEAISRLEALWRSWEVLRLKRWEGGVLWYRDLDAHLSLLLAPDGPFAQCTPDRHTPITPLPVTPAPEGWFGYPDDPDGEPLAEDSPDR